MVFVSCVGAQSTNVGTDPRGYVSEVRELSKNLTWGIGQ